MAGVGVRRFDAEAKYSLLKERTDAPNTVVLRLVCDENVLSMRLAGTLSVEIVFVELDVWSAMDSADVALSKASCGIDEISMVLCCVFACSEDISIN